MFSYSYVFSEYSLFLELFSCLNFFVCHIGWSALWLSQTVLVFKLAHNLLIPAINLLLYPHIGCIDEVILRTSFLG